MLEGKDKEYLNTIYTNFRKIRHVTFNYLNFFSMKNKDYKESYLNYKYSFPPDNGIKNIELNEEEIIKRNELFFKNIMNELSTMNKLLASLKEHIEVSNRNNGINRNNQDIINNLDYQEKIISNNTHNREIIQRTDLLYLIFKAIINSSYDLYIRETIKNERRSNLLLFRNKFLKSQRPSNDMERNISPNEVIKEYITKNFIETNIKINIDIININSKIYSKSRMPIPLAKMANININIGPMYFLISLPFEREYSHTFRPNVSVNNLYLFEPKSVISKTILFQKIKNMLIHRIHPLLNLVYEKKKSMLYNNPNSTSIKMDKDFLVEFSKKLVNYLFDYDRIFKIKCDYCGKLAKYSLYENYFFPPYFKMYKEKEIPLPQNNKVPIDFEKNLFYHEDCFKKISNSSI